MRKHLAGTLALLIAAYPQTVLAEGAVGEFLQTKSADAVPGAVIKLDTSFLQTEKIDPAISESAGVDNDLTTVEQEPVRDLDAAAPIEISAAQAKDAETWPAMIASKLAVFPSFLKLRSSASNVVGNSAGRTIQDRFWDGLKGAPALAIALPLQTHAAEVSAHAGTLSPAPRVAGTVLLAYGATRLAKKAIEHHGIKKGWDEDKISLRKVQASLAIWGGAVLLAFWELGVSLDNIIGKLGAIVAIAGGDIINNIVELGRVIVGRPFDYEDLVRIGSKKYVIHCLGLAHVLLRKPGKKEASTFMLYTDLSKSPITLLRKAPVKGGKKNLKVLNKKFLSLVAYFIKSSVSPAHVRSTARAAFFCAVVAAVTFLPASAALPWLSPILIVLRSISLFEVVMSAGRSADSILREMAGRESWPLQKLDQIALPMQLFVWALAGGIALKSLGVPWSALGWGAFGLSMVTQDLLGGLWRWFNLRFGWVIGLHGYLKIGDGATVAGIKGTVTEINPSYLVLKRKNGSKAYLNYSLSSTFTSPDAANRVSPR